MKCTCPNFCADFWLLELEVALNSPEFFFLLRQTNNLQFKPIYNLLLLLTAQQSKMSSEVWPWVRRIIIHSNDHNILQLSPNTSEAKKCLSFCHSTVMDEWIKIRKIDNESWCNTNCLNDHCPIWPLFFCGQSKNNWSTLNCMGTGVWIILLNAFVHYRIFIFDQQSMQITQFIQTSKHCWIIVTSWFIR